MRLTNVLRRRESGGGWLVAGGWWLVAGEASSSPATRHQPPATKLEDPSVATADPALPSARGWKEVLTYLATPLLALAVAVLVMRLWRADLTVPLAYEHDSFPVLMWTKTIIDNGWWLTNQYVGAPVQLEMHDYPTNCNLHFAVLKA